MFNSDIGFVNEAAIDLPDEGHLQLVPLCLVVLLNGVIIINVVLLANAPVLCNNSGSDCLKILI